MYLYLHKSMFVLLLLILLLFSFYLCFLFIFIFEFFLIFCSSKLHSCLYIYVFFQKELYTSSFSLVLFLSLSIFLSFYLSLSYLSMFLFPPSMKVCTLHPSVEFLRDKENIKDTEQRSMSKIPNDVIRFW